MSPPLLSRGVLITFEGGEGAGKSSVINRLAEHLSSEGYSVLKTREPGSTHLGEHLRQLLLESSTQDLSSIAELCLFLAARAQHLKDVILPALQHSKIVLCDRFNDSTIAYQGAARGLGMERVADLCHFICQGTSPDLTLYLDVDPVLGLKRASQQNLSDGRKESLDRIESETIDFHTTIREAFLSIQAKEPHRLRLLDASRSKEEVFMQAMECIRPLLTKAEISS